MNRQFRPLAAGAVLLAASVALADTAPPKTPEKSGAPENKPGTAETNSAAGVAPPPAKAAGDRPAAATRKPKAAGTYQTVPNAQLGLGCSSAE